MAVIAENGLQNSTSFLYIGHFQEAVMVGKCALIQLLSQIAQFESQIWMSLDFVSGGDKPSRLMSVLHHFCIMSSPVKPINDDANSDHPPSIFMSGSDVYF